MSEGTDEKTSEVVAENQAGTSPSLSTNPDASEQSETKSESVNDGVKMETPPDTQAPAELKLKLGKDSPFQDGDLSLFTEFAKENKFDQKTAESMLTYTEGLVGRINARRQAEQEQTMEGWIDAASKDQEVGGAKFDESKQLAYKVNQRFGTPELRDFLDQGIGNHPEIFKFFVRVGRAMQDDTRESGMAIPKKEVPFAQQLYGGSSG